MGLAEELIARFEEAVNEQGATRAASYVFKGKAREAAEARHKLATERVDRLRAQIIKHLKGEV